MRPSLSSILTLAALVAGLTAAAAVASAPPVGPLPKGPVTTIKLAGGRTFTVTLPKPKVAGRVWRIARPFDADVAREVREGETATAIKVTFRTVGAGTTRVVFALTRGETPHAYAARTYRVVVPKRTTSSAAAACPTLLPLGANSIAPAVTAALRADPAKNRPQVTGALLAPNDQQRGPQAKAQCGKPIWQRTVVVYITDRAFLPAQSAAQRVLFVGRTAAGYRVWLRAH